MHTFHESTICKLTLLQCLKNRHFKGAAQSLYIYIIQYSICTEYFCLGTALSCYHNSEHQRINSNALAIIKRPSKNKTPFQKYNALAIIKRPSKNKTPFQKYNALAIIKRSSKNKTSIHEPSTSQNVNYRNVDAFKYRQHKTVNFQTMSIF